MYAIVEISGKQYRVEKDKTINVDKLSSEKENFNIEKILLCVDGDKVLVGQPYLNNVEIAAKVLGSFKGKKVHGIKFKKRKNYTRTIGQRAELSRLQISDLKIK